MILVVAGHMLWWFFGLLTLLLTLVWAMGWVGGLIDGYNKAARDRTAGDCPRCGPDTITFDLIDALITSHELEVTQLAEQGDQEIGRLGYESSHQRVPRQRPLER